MYEDFQERMVEYGLTALSTPQQKPYDSASLIVTSPLVTCAIQRKNENWVEMNHRGKVRRVGDKRRVK